MPLRAYALACKTHHRHSKSAEDLKSNQGLLDMFWVEQCQTQSGCGSLYNYILDLEDLFEQPQSSHEYVAKECDAQHHTAHQSIPY